MKLNKEERVKYGKKLKQYRENCNLTQEEVVIKVKEFIEKHCNENEDYTYFTQTQLSNWENGKYIPHHINRFLLAKIYNISIEELEDNFPNGNMEMVTSYVEDLAEEDKVYILENNQLFETEIEKKETPSDRYRIGDNQAFLNGTHVEIHSLLKLVTNQHWDIEKRLQYIIDLHMRCELSIPQILIQALNERDSDKKAQIYYQYYASFYNGSLWASKKNKKK